MSGMTTTLSNFIAAYNSNKEFLGRTGGTRATTLTVNQSSFVNGTAQGTGNIAYLRVTQYKTSADSGTIDDVDNLNLQLEVGNTNTEYIEHKQNKRIFILNEPLRAIGNVKDRLYIQNGILYVERKIESTILNGTENTWAVVNTGTANFFYRLRYLQNVGTKGEGYYLSNRFSFYAISSTNTAEGMYITSSNELRLRFGTEMTITDFKTWLSNNKVELQYLLDEPYIEELGQIQIPGTYENITHINTTDNLQPNMNITYVRNTQISNYVEQHIAEIKVNEEGITERVESIENNGLEDRVQSVETRQTATERTIEIKTQNIDAEGNITEVRTSRGFKFDDNGLDINTGENSFHTTIDEDSTDYKDGNTIVSTTSKDGSALRMLRMLEQNYYSYNDSNPNNILDTSNYDFIDERIEVDGEYAYATFYNGED